jgi:hypothetical protein
VHFEAPNIEDNKCLVTYLMTDLGGGDFTSAIEHRAH